MSFWTNATNNIEEAEKNNKGVFEALPAGDYTAVITDCTSKENKAGTGSYVNLKLEITGPTHTGRVIFEMLNLFNPSAKAVEIAVGTLHQICIAAGNEAYYDTMKTSCTSEAKAKEYLSDNNLFSAIGNRPLAIKLAIKADETYGDKNVIKRWKAGGGAVTAPTDKSAVKKPF